MARRRRRAGRWTLLVPLICVLGDPAAAAEPPESGWDQARRAGRTGFDLVILRPFQFVQLIVSAAVFVPSYPISFLFDGDEDVMEICITHPAERLFERPLGEL